MRNIPLILSCFILFISCTPQADTEGEKASSLNLPDQAYIAVLGIAQDGGYPQAGCRKDCCKEFREGKEPAHYASCLAIVDPYTGERWLIDATPDFPEQLHLLNKMAPSKSEPILSGIFLTHGHIGHYAGLMYLGRAVMGAKKIPVYTMPLMKNFIENNGPWNLLVELENIHLHEMTAGKVVSLNKKIQLTPFLVPHRGEYTETVGLLIEGPETRVLYISDIDRWEEWETDIVQIIKEVDIAFLDATFYSSDELPGRNMDEVPHPTMQHSMDLFKNLSDNDKAKIHFIHMNHTNPAIRQNSKAFRTIKNEGFNLAKEGQVIPL